MIKVLHVLSTGLVGGTEMMTLRLIRGMDPNRFTNHVAFFRGGGPIQDDLRRMQIPVTVLNWSPARTLPAARELVQLLRRERYDIVQVYGLKANMLVRPAAALCRVPVLITAQRSVDLDRRPWHSLADRLTSPAVDLYLSNSQAAADLLASRERIARAKIRTVHNGIDAQLVRKWEDHRATVREELGLGPDEVGVGVVARCEYPKRMEILLQAAASLPDGLPVRILIAGDGALLQKWKTQADRMGLSDGRVRFLGLRRDVPRLLSAFDLFVLPTQWEGLPGAVMEAMCAGLPVVSARVGGIPELVLEGETGFLVNPEDVQGFAQVITRLSRDSGLRKAMGEAGYQRIAEHFSIESMVRRTEAIYEELVQSKV